MPKKLNKKRQMFTKQKSIALDKRQKNYGVDKMEEWNRCRVSNEKLWKNIFNDQEKNND